MRNVEIKIILIIVLIAGISCLTGLRSAQSSASQYDWTGTWKTSRTSVGEEYGPHPNEAAAYFRGELLMALKQTGESVTGTYRTDPDPYSYAGESVSIHGEIRGTINEGGYLVGYWSETFRHTKQDGTVEEYQRDGDLMMYNDKPSDDLPVLLHGDWSESGWGKSNGVAEGSWDGSQLSEEISTIDTSRSSTLITTTATNALYSVFMGDPNDAWAVGTNGWIVNWDGSKWTLVSSPTDNSRGNTLYSVFMVTWEDAWAVGSDGWIIRWDGSSWSNVESPTRDTLMSIYMSSQNDGWAVGHSGRIIHWDGLSWSNVESPTKQRLKSVSVSHSGTEAFAVGDDGTIIHWTSQTDTWELEKEEAMVPYPREWLNSVFTVDAGDAWAVGNLGQTIHYDGEKWSIVSSPTVNNLNSVFMLSSLQGIAVGDRGTIIYLDLTSNDSWNTVESSIQADLYSVSVEMVSGTHGWTVGEAGNGLRLQVQPSYYQPGQTATSMQKVMYTATTLSAPVATVQNNPAGGYLSGGYLPAVVIVIAVVVGALLLGRRYVTKKKNKQP